MQNVASLAENHKGIEVIKITFPDDLQTIERVKSLTGRQYHIQNKCWSCPLTLENLEQLEKWDFLISEELQTFMQNSKLRKSEISINGIEGLKGELRQFQKEGVAFIENKKGRVLIGDEMGLGKTIQALAWLQLHRDILPVIIVVPASLKLNWQREYKNWLPDANIEVLSTTNSWKTYADILIINYDVLFAWTEELKKRDPKILILDEVQAIKSNSAKRTKAVKRLAKDIPHIICLSGTPIINRPIEIFNAVKILDPDIFPNYIYFTRHFCNARNNGFGIDVSGHSNTKELHKILTDTIMIRRKKSDVLKELPEKIYSFIPIELDNAKEYDFAEADFIKYIRQQKGEDAANRIKNFEALPKIEALKQLAVKGKLKQVINWIKDFLESDNKLVVFGTHRFVIEELMNEFSKIAVKIDGSTSTLQRQKSVDEFQNDENVRLFIGNIQAAGKGITLTASSNCAIIEFPWSPGELSQAIDRLHRITQKFSVTAYFLFAQNTIEEKIVKILDTKTKILDAVLDGKETEQESLLTEIMKSYR